VGSKKALFMRPKINYYTLAVELAKVRYYQGLSEKQQRHFLGMEYIMLGRGSKLYLSKLYQCSRNRITLGYVERTIKDTLLTDLQQMKTLIERTSTITGLSVTVRIHLFDYPTGQPSDKKLINPKRILYAKTLPQLNYTILT
jgi:hypothetical protein